MQTIIDMNNKAVVGSCRAGEFKKQLQELKTYLYLSLSPEEEYIITTRRHYG